MAGPGIRYHFMAEYLSKDFSVCVGFFSPENLPDDDFKKSYEVRSIDAFEFEADFSEFDYVVALWLSDSMMHFCNTKKIVVVFDMYAPVPVENLALNLFSSGTISKDKDSEYINSLRMYRKFFENGDLFIYSNSRQRDYWIGYIFGALQILPSTYAKRPAYDQFIEAPMGIDNHQILKHTKNVMRGVIDGISEKDTIVIWTGGIWDWFDGVTPIEAMSLLANMGREDIKLVFLGTQHPNATVPKMSEVSRSRETADRLGLLGKNVFFLEGWVGYEDRINYLLEADVAIYCHKPSIETEFSHRTRVLDHFLASIPTIGTRGDYLGEVIERTGMGIMIEPNNSEALANAIVDASKTDSVKWYKDNIKKNRDTFAWENTLEPLRKYLLSNPEKMTQTYKNTSSLSGKTLEKIKKAIPTPLKTLIKRILPLRND